MKTVYSHLDITHVFSLVECSGMFELFKKDIDKFKFPLESPSMFLSDDSVSNNMK